VGRGEQRRFQSGPVQLVDVQAVLVGGDRDGLQAPVGQFVAGASGARVFYGYRGMAGGCECLGEQGKCREVVAFGLSYCVFGVCDGR
jgi:hypothetical protein